METKKIFFCSTLVKNPFDHFGINLKDLMEWKKCEQQENYFQPAYNEYEDERIRFSGDLYKEHLIVLSREKQDDDNEKNQLRCWNISIQSLLPLFLIIIETNSWRIFNIKETGLDKLFSNPIVYKSSLWVLGQSRKKICLAKYDLNSKKELDFFSNST